MAKRKALSKKIRFEVFKRDKFTCQYCGRTVPDVILEVDHIKPVAKGGQNDILNLVTSCKDCNLGKGARELSDDSVVAKQREQVMEFANKKEQLQMFLEWRDSIKDYEEQQIEAVVKIFKDRTKHTPPVSVREKIKLLIKQYSLNEVLDATDISITQYYNEKRASESLNYAIGKISGIIYNRRKLNDKSMYWFFYLRKICNAEFDYCDDSVLRDVVSNFCEDDFDDAKYYIKSCENWEQFIVHFIDE